MAAVGLDGNVGVYVTKGLAEEIALFLCLPSFTMARFISAYKTLFSQIYVYLLFTGMSCTHDAACATSIPCLCIQRPNY